MSAAPVTAAVPGGTPPRLVRSELTKVLSTRLCGGLLVGVVLLTAVQAGVGAGFAGAEAGAGQPATPGLETPEAIRGVYAGSAFAGAYVFALVLGVVAMTSEFRYQTVTPTFLATPRRGRVVGAKAAAHVVVGLGFGLVALLTALVVGGVVVLLREGTLALGTDGLWRAAALAVLAVALWTLIGIGVGTLVTNQIAAILVAVAFTFVLEPVASLGLSAADLDGVARFLPSNASSAMTSPPEVIGALLPWWGGVLALLGYAAGFAVVGALLSMRRDVT